MKKTWFHPFIFMTMLLSANPALQAHDTPVQIPPPQSTGEAWDVIQQSKNNIDHLLAANLTRDIAGQLANISIALRFINSNAQGQNAAGIQTQSAALVTEEAELLTDSRDTDHPPDKTWPAWNKWCQDLAKFAQLFPADTLRAEIFICPMHPLDRHLDSTAKCSVCGMSLVRRHLPASGIYQLPGEPRFKIQAICPLLTIGQLATVRIQLKKPDGSPVLLADLIEMHAKKIHLLINDHSLGDYHHVHPVPTDIPGEYQFEFTPALPGPYRLWADVVPADSGVQEYDIADLPASSKSLPITNRETRLISVVDGRRYELSFATNGQPIRARQTVVGTIAVTDQDGQPFTQLEPLMGAFAHLVGFSEDGKSVLHIHPSSKQPSGPDDRAGPVFAFKFYAPAPGFLRLYCQVQIHGKDVFAPFNLNIAK